MPSSVSASSSFGEIIANAMGQRVSRYDKVADLKWVSEPHQHIRKLVHFRAVKGATYCGTWGYSVDFVPVLRGLANSTPRLASKRTAKVAEFDLRIGPVDDNFRGQAWYSFSWLDPNPDRIADVGVAVFDAAFSDFAKVSGLGDLRSLFSERSQMKVSGISLSNFTQTDLCWGLLCIACGDEMEGMKRLEAFCARFSVDRQAKALVSAIETARGVALGG